MLTNGSSPKQRRRNKDVLSLIFIGCFFIVRTRMRLSWISCHRVFTVPTVHYWRTRKTAIIIILDIDLRQSRRRPRAHWKRRNKMYHLPTMRSNFGYFPSILSVNKFYISFYFFIHRPASLLVFIAVYVSISRPLLAPTGPNRKCYIMRTETK